MEVMNIGARWQLRGRFDSELARGFLETFSPPRLDGAAFYQVPRPADRGAGHPCDRRRSPRKSPRRRRSGSPDRRRRASPRREERSRSRRRRPSPHRDGRSRSCRRCRRRDRDVERRRSDRPQGRGPRSQAVEDSVQARRWQSRPGHPQEARRQGEKGFQDWGKAQGRNQIQGDWADAGKRIAGRIRAGLRMARTEVAKARARAEDAGEEARARKPGSARKPDMPSPERRSSGISRNAERGARPRGSPRRSRTSTGAGAAAGVATGRAEPTTGPAGQTQSRRSCASLPGGSSESPRTAEGSAPSPGHGTQVFHGRTRSLVHRFPRFCELC